MNQIKKKLLPVFLIFTWLLVFELTATIWIYFKGNPYQKSLKILEPQKELGWKHKKFLNTNFYGANVQTNSFGFRNSFPLKHYSSSKHLILTFGPSSAFGWSVEANKTYTSRLKQRLNDDHPKRYESANLSQVGYSSFQGQLLLRKPQINSLKPEILILAYGVNDVDRYRFYFQSNLPDHKELSKKRGWKELAALKAINGSSFLQTLISTVSEPMMNFKCDHLKNIPNRRVSTPETIKYFKKIVKFYKTQNNKTVILTTPHQYRNLDLKLSKNHSYSLYKEMSQAANLGKCKEAKKYFLAARISERSTIVHDIIDLNSKIREFAIKNKYILIDAEQLLKKDEYFSDPIHPSALGHDIIALEMYKIIKSGGDDG